MSAVYLTAREQKILHWVSDGESDATIARRLGISPSSVGQQLTLLRARMGAANRTHMVTRGVALGLLHIERETS